MKRGSDAREQLAGVNIDRIIAAPVEAVFAAWTDPTSMAQWFSPTGIAEVEADVHVGGALRVVMLGEGMRIEHTGEYLAVEPPHRLSFTWQSPYTGAQPSVVTVLLEEADAGTRLRLTHDRLPVEHEASHEGGWGSILARLAAVVDSAGAMHGTH